MIPGVWKVPKSHLRNEAPKREERSFPTSWASNFFRVVEEKSDTFYQFGAVPGRDDLPGTRLFNDARSQVFRRSRQHNRAPRAEIAENF